MNERTSTLQSEFYLLCNYFVCVCVVIIQLFELSAYKML